MTWLIIYHLPHASQTQHEWLPELHRTLHCPFDTNFLFENLRTALILLNLVPNQISELSERFLAQNLAQSASTCVYPSSCSITVALRDNNGRSRPFFLSQGRSRPLTLFYMLICYVMILIQACEKTHCFRKNTILRRLSILDLLGFFHCRTIYGGDDGLSRVTGGYQILLLDWVTRGFQ